MFQWMSKKLNQKRKGFTLIELVVVIAILGILAAIAIPRFTNSRTTAAITSHNANVRTLESAASVYLAENGIPATDDIVWDGTATTKVTVDGIEVYPDTAWELYLQSYPVPTDGTGNTDVEEATTYTVTIGTDGTIAIDPEKIPD